MNDKKRTIGEVQFEAYLKAARYPFEYEKVYPGKSKRPDYTVTKGGTFLFDVKDFDPRVPEGLGIVQGDMYSGIRRQIEAGRKKFTEYKEFPCCVVLRNNGNVFVDTENPHTVFGAMYGDFGFAIPVYVGEGIAPTPPPPIRPTFLRGASMLPDKNTTISALITVRYIAVGRRLLGQIFKEKPRLSVAEAIDAAKMRFGDDFDEGEMQQGVIVWENVYARLALPRELFTGRYDERFGLDGSDLTRVFCGESLAALES